MPGTVESFLERRYCVPPSSEDVLQNPDVTSSRSEDGDRSDACDDNVLRQLLELRKQPFGCRLRRNGSGGLGCKTQKWNGGDRAGLTAKRLKTGVEPFYCPSLVLLRDRMGKRSSNEFYGVPIAHDGRRSAEGAKSKQMEL